MNATDPETLLTDPDFRAAIAGGGGKTVVQALENVDERGVCFQTLGSEQYSGKSYLDGGELPVGLSEEVLKVGNMARKQLKAMKKADKPRHFLEKMKSVDKFVEERCIFVSNLSFLLLV